MQSIKNQKINYVTIDKFYDLGEFRYDGYDFEFIKPSDNLFGAMVEIIRKANYCHGFIFKYAGRLNLIYAPETVEFKECRCTSCIGFRRYVINLEKEKIEKRVYLIDMCLGCPYLWAEVDGKYYCQLVKQKEKNVAEVKQLDGTIKLVEINDYRIILDIFNIPKWCDLPKQQKIKVKAKYKRGKWTKKECELLLKLRNIENFTFINISSELNRSPESIRRKYNKLEK